MNIEDKLYWFWLSACVKLNVKAKHELLEAYKTPLGVFEAAKAKKLKQEHFKYEEKLYSASLSIKKSEEEYHKLVRKGIDFITIDDERYPWRLKNIYEPPIALYVRGELPSEKKTAAIIGARDCSHYGAETAGWFGAALAEQGIQIVSGMALGIDTKGLCGAMSKGGRTFAVLGSGIDVVYPPENILVYEDIINCGGVISEYPPGEKPLAYHFPQRNRIISAFADCIIVVEARKKSGSLITADFALEQGKDVAAVPGRHSDVLSAGTNSLIKNGAYLVSSPEDVLEILEIDCKISVKTSQSNKNMLDKTKEKVYSCLHLEPKYIETIIEECGMSYGEVLEILVWLEMEGYIKQTSRNYYAAVLL